MKLKAENSINNGYEPRNLDKDFEVFIMYKYLNNTKNLYVLKFGIIVLFSQKEQAINNLAAALESAHKVAPYVEEEQ